MLKIFWILHCHFAFCSLHYTFLCYISFPLTIIPPLYRIIIDMNVVNKIYENNKAIFWAAVVSIILSAGVLLKVPDEVTRFTLIMPIFAGFILFSILVTPDEELEDSPNKEEEKTKKPVSKSAKKK